MSATRRQAVPLPSETTSTFETPDRISSSAFSIRSPWRPGPRTMRASARPGASLDGHANKNPVARTQARTRTSTVPVATPRRRIVNPLVSVCGCLRSGGRSERPRGAGFPRSIGVLGGLDRIAELQHCYPCVATQWRCQREQLAVERFQAAPDKREGSSFSEPDRRQRGKMEEAGLDTAEVTPCQLEITHEERMLVRGP